MENKPDIRRIIEQEGIELKRGKALCPFHDERTPSFTVNENGRLFIVGGAVNMGTLFHSL